MTEHSRPLLEADTYRDPFRQLDVWFDEAVQAGIELPEAAALATATPSGEPSVRMVLLKQLGRDGFVFYTNYESRKGRELEANPRAALLLHWQTLGRQVRVEGPVERVPELESAQYFETRPLGARLSAWVSPQSQVVPSRELLEERVEELRAHLGEELVLPPHWGGFLLHASVIEFWQHRADRLHDRLRFRRETGTWVLERLAP